MVDELFVVTQDGRAIGRRYHLLKDCTTVNDVGKVDTITNREANLLGLKVCSVCEKRQTGGPALTALREVLCAVTNDVDGQEATEAHAWMVLDGLKEQGFYISSRRKKDTE